MELYCPSREEWREWLGKNHLKSDGVWLVYYKKPSGKPRIPYSDAVEEALCFGWIDGKIKRINEDYYIQWFTPRRSGSRWSNLNVQRVRALLRSGQMQPAGLKAYQKLLDKPGLMRDSPVPADTGIPEDLKKALMSSPAAYGNFMKFSRRGRNLYIHWLNSAKKEDTRIRRIEKIVEFSEKNIRPGII